MTESQVDNTKDDGSTDESIDSTSGLSKEQLEAEVKKLRQEAGGRRVLGKQKDAEHAKTLAELDEIKKSQMSEVDRVKAENAELAKAVNTMKVERLQLAVAKAAGLDPDLAELITGESEEEMLAKAEKLAAKTGGKSTQDTNTASNMFAGVRGKPVGADADAKTESEWFRNQFSK